MKTMILSLLGLTIFSGTQAFADVRADFNSLGSSKKIIRRAKRLDTKNRYQIVQKREVDRYNRLEVSGNASLQFGGDSYYESSTFGAGLDYHFTPRWSLGLRYYKYSHDFTEEGDRRNKQAQLDHANGQVSSLPETNQADNSTMAIISYYPIYGKLNVFNKSTIQFDVYVLGGAGSIQLDKTGNAATYTAGGGVGVWFNQYLTARFEARYQTYKEESTHNFDARTMNITAGTISLGILL